MSGVRGLLLAPERTNMANKKAIPESKETPKMEAKEHSKKFLKKAVSLSDKKKKK
jgi:hypothetical protein